MPAAVLIPAIGAAVGGGAAAGASIYGAKKQSAAARAAADAQQRTANYAADVEARANADQLTFAKQQEDERKAEWQKTQDLNQANYGTERATDESRYQDAQALIAAKTARLAPYVNWGYGSIGQLMRPISSGTAGSIGSRMGG